MATMGAISLAAPYTFKYNILDESWLGGESADGHTQFDPQVNNKTDFSQGFVQDLNMEDAKLGGLLTAQDGKAYVGVNYKDTLPTDYSIGRQSVNLWNHVPLVEGLYIFNIEHAPVAGCTLYSYLRMAAIDPVLGQQETISIVPNYMDWIGYTGSAKYSPTSNKGPPVMID